MRTMKRVAAFAMTVAVIMTSGVTTKAAVTNVQPTKDVSETNLKWANQISTGYDTLSEIKLVGKYVYAADDSQHRIIKINKDTGKIEKQHKYHDESYSQYYVGNIAYGDGKIYVAYANKLETGENGETNTVANGRIEAFDADTLEPVWISEAAYHTEKDSETGEAKTVYDMVASRLFYDNGHLYYGTGTGTPGSNYGWDKTGKYYVLDTVDEDKTKTDEIKKIKEITSSSEEGNFYLKNGVKVGNYIVASDTKGKIFTIDTKTSKVVATKEFGEVFSGNMAYDKTTNTIYFVVGTNDLYGIKVNSDGSFGKENHVRVYKTGYSAMTPEVYNGKVYLSGSKGTSGVDGNGYFAVVDVRTSNYKVNYTVDLPAYSQGEMLVSKTGKNSVRLYFTVNYAKTDENYNPLSGGGIYSIEDKEGAKSAKLETVYEPEQKYANYCLSSISVDENGTMYYSNDSRTIFAVARQPIIKAQKTTRSIKLTWKKNKSAKGYVIYAKAGNGKYKKLTTVGKTTKKTVKVNAGTSYKFKVRPYIKKKGKKVTKYYKAYAAKAKNGSKTIKVTYKNVKGYESYRIDMKVGNGSYKKVLTSKKAGTLTLTYTQKNAKVGKNYKFRLVGIKMVDKKPVEKTIK